MYEVTELLDGLLLVYDGLLSGFQLALHLNYHQGFVSKVLLHVTDYSDYIIVNCTIAKG